MWDNRIIVECAQNHSRLTLGSCLINQEQAREGARALLSGESVCEVPEHQIERMLTCGQCDKCGVGVHVDQVMEVLKGEFAKIADRLENFDWYEKDAEVMSLRVKRRLKRRWQVVKRRKQVG